MEQAGGHDVGAGQEGSHSRGQVRRRFPCMPRRPQAFTQCTVKSDYTPLPKTTSLNFKRAVWFVRQFVRLDISVRVVPEAAVRDEAVGTVEAKAADDEDAAAAGGTIEATPTVLFRPIARLLTGPRLG